jgi:DNA-binding response OmpR family regulator
VSVPDVLLIEDAWRFRAAIKAQLMELGFEVLRLPTLEAGVKLLTALHRARPRLVIVDTIGQPHVSGLLPQLRAAAEGIPMILCTGPFDREMSHFNPDDWAAILVRPFSIGDLVGKVVQLLGEA